MSNLRQISLGILLRCEEADENAKLHGGTNLAGLNWTVYFNWINNAISTPDRSSGQKRLLVCPADKFYYDPKTLAEIRQPLHEQSFSDHSSYAFNGPNVRTNPAVRGIEGRTSSSIKNPARTVLVAEGPAYVPYSWHEPKRHSADRPPFNNVKNGIGYVDGHVSYTKIFWTNNHPAGTLAVDQEPPAGYDYKWSPD